MARVVSVNVGTPQQISVRRGRPLMSAIGKQPVEGRVRVAGVNLEGDDQADRRVHGGPDKAVYAYAAEDTAWWAARARPRAAAGHVRREPHHRGHRRQRRRDRRALADRRPSSSRSASRGCRARSSALRFGDLEMVKRFGAGQPRPAPTCGSSARASCGAGDEIEVVSRPGARRHHPPGRPTRSCSTTRCSAPPPPHPSCRRTWPVGWPSAPPSLRRTSDRAGRDPAGAARRAPRRSRRSTGRRPRASGPRARRRAQALGGDVRAGLVGLRHQHDELLVVPAREHVRVAQRGLKARQRVGEPLGRQLEPHDRAQSPVAPPLTDQALEDVGWPSPGRAGPCPLPRPESAAA